MNLRKRIIVLGIILTIILNYVISINTSIAAEIDTAGLYSKGIMQRLLRLGNIIVESEFVVYKKDGVEYPAYCLDKDVQGVTSEESYSVSVNDLISNVMVWKVITNGYPYKSAKELGCDNSDQAYLATKQAVYCVIYNRDPNSYEAIGEPRRKMFKSIKKYSCKC